MKVELQVLATTSIKRKKPWPRLAFLGQAQESLFLLDNQRVSVLYVPSGKTKRRISSLEPLLHNTTALQYSHEGSFLVGLLTSGDAYLWHKDSNRLKFLQGFESLAYKGEIHVPACQKPHLWVSDSGRHLVASAPGFVDTLVWEAGPTQQVLSSNSNQVQGTWSVIEVPPHVLLPGKASFEASSNACFCVKECIGECCLYSCVFYHGNQICVTTLLIQWLDTQQIYSYRQPTYQAEWKSKLHPLTQIDPEATPLENPGAFVTKFSNDGQLLAIAVNQNRVSCCKLMYVAPCHDVVVCADLKDMGTRGPMDASSVRSYWVTNLQWTHDDLYVVCINGQGLVAMLTRLGEPVLLATQGLSPEMGPRFYLPLHPLMSVQCPSDDDDPMRQRFSVAVHPCNPIIVTSDGFMVTVLRYAPETTCLSLMTSLSAEAVRHLRRVRELQQTSSSMFDSVRKQSQHAMRQKQGARSRGLHCEPGAASVVDYKFEAPEEDALDDTLERPLLSSQVSLPNGRITFGDADNLNTTLQHAHHITEEALNPSEHLSRAHRALFGAWALAVSHTGVWTTHHEEALSNITHNMSRLLSLLLNCKASVLKELADLQGVRNGKKSSKQSRGLRRALHLFTSVLSLLPLDCLHRNAQVCVLDLIHSVVSLLASSPALHDVHPHVQTLQGCYALLRHSEVMLQKAYDCSAGVLQSNVDPYAGCDTSLCNADLFSPSLSESPRSIDQTIPKQSLNLNQNASSTPTDLPSDTNGINRLGRSWVYLYRQSMQHYKSLLRTCLQQDSVPEPKLAATLQKTILLDSKRILQLLYTLQCRLHSLHQDLPRKKRKHHLRKGDKLCIEGTSSPAVFSWLHFIESSSDHDLVSHSVGRLLHGVLYSHLINDDLYSAIELVELLAREGDPRKGAALARQDAQSRLSALSQLQQVPVNTEPQAPSPVLENALVRHLVVTLARIMGAYFSNGKPFVYPPHQPFRVPPLHTVYKIEHRTVPLYRDAISAAVRQSQLGHVWTPERSLCYLLLGGALVEGVWLLHALGDWKAAFIVSSACVYHQKNLAPQLYERKKKLLLPESLLPVSILKEQLAQIVQNTSDSAPMLVTDESDLEHLNSTLRDILLATCFCEIDIVPWILETLMSRLKNAVSQLKPLVPAGLYLPAPPVYCPQPASNLTKEHEEEVVEELRLRKEASSVVVLISILLNASHTATPALSWYAQRVLQVFTSSMKKRKTGQPLMLDIEFLQETYLQGSSAFQGHEVMGSVQRVLVVLRDLCSVCWMLHVRDELSIALRKKPRMADEGMKADADVKAWQQHCRKTLHWCRQLMPFRQFLREGHEVCHSLISLLMELPQNTEMAKVLAEHFYDLDTHEPEVQDKIRHILNEWKGVMVGEEERPDDSPLDSPRSLPGESPRGIPLSVYYHGKANSVSKLFRQRVRTFGHFEEFVFKKATDTVQNGVLHVGSRGFESAQEYLQFLDRLFAVSFSRLAESESDTSVTWPLLLEFSSKVRGRELRSLSRRESVKSHSAAAHKGQSILVIQSPREPLPSSPRRSRPPKTSSLLPKGPRRKGGGGLFRSHSLSEAKKPTRPMRKQRSSSDEDLSQSNSLSRKPLHRQTSNEEAESDPLNKQFVSPWMLDSFSYEKGYQKMEQRLDWLNAWSAHNHTLFPGAKDDAKEGALRCAMKLRVSPKLLVYALWLLDNCHYKAPLEPAATEITVAAVHRQQVIPTDRTASPESPQAVPFTPTVVTPDISGIEPLSNSKEKKKKKKGKEKKRKEENREVEEMMLTQEFVAEVRLSNNTPKKLSFKLPGDDVDENAQINHMVDQTSDTEGTLEVSSLNEDDLKRSMQESAALSQVESLRLSDLEGSSHIRQFSPIPEASPASTLVDQGMNTTLHLEDSRQSVEPSNGEVAGQVQNVVRQEMRRLMEAQHRGILAMMGALDEAPGQLPEVEQQMSKLKVDEHPVTSESSRLALSDLGLTDSRRGHNVEEALDDLQLLRNQLSDDNKRKKRSDRSDKENTQRQWHPADYSQDQPYAGLMNTLREINHELGGQPSPRNDHGPPSLLRMPSSAEESLRLPVIPMPPSSRQAWSSDAQQSSGRMPLLQLNRSDASNSHYFSQQIPERDTNHQEREEALHFHAPFPLLHLPGDAHLYSDAQPSTMPSLASADEVMAYHRKKLEEAQRNQQMLNDAIRQELGKKTQEETKPPSQQSREKRRKAKKSKEVRKKVKLKKKGDESEEGLESLPMDTLPDTLSALREETISASKDLGTAESAVPQILHSGYALSPGLCDDFLGKEDEVGLPHSTTSNIHYQAAMKLQENSKKKVLKKDMFTETDPILEEKATSTHATPRNIGSNFAEAGSILPPDIFMGLQFNEPGVAPSARNTEGQSHSYINVVDINAEALDDIRPRRQSSRHSPRKTSPRQVKFQSRTQEADDAELMPGPDPTTLRLLRPSKPEGRDLTLPEEDEMMKNKRYHSKTYIKKRLQDMNEQFNAIESLQRNIEDDFKASKLLAHTIEQFGEAMMPEREEPTARVLDRFGDEEETAEEAASPRRQRVEPPLIESQASPRHRPQKREQVSEVHLSGLSGVSDIVGEMLARGSMDPADVGLTQREAQNLMQKALDSERHGMRLSNEELLHALNESLGSPEARKGRSEGQKKELQQWMQVKRRERSQEHKRRQTELRDHEKKPFRSGGQLGATMQEMQTAEQQRQEKKKTLLLDHEDKRLREASLLMGEILHDKPPEVPDQPTRVKKTPPKKTAAPRSRSLPRKVSSMEHRMTSPRRDEWTSFRTERRPSIPECAVSAAPIRSARSEPVRPEPTEKKYRPPHTQKKSFTEMVRLQRPESTRSKKNRPPPKTYTERLMETKSSDGATPRTPISPHRLYGSSRLPQSAKQDDRPRVVKSYTERLQDIKRTRTINTGPWQRPRFDEPKDTRVMRGGRLTELKRAAILPSKPRKTLSYSEQLRQLQPPKEMYRSGTSTFTVKPNRKWHKAPHKPKTYVQQLRELQQPSTSREGLMHPASSIQRSRPYADPYVEVDDASVVSPWSVDDDVQRLLNEGHTAQTNTEATDLDLSELQHLAELPYDDDEDMEYADLVALQDIADAASLAGSSIMSFIDWDQVNDLIADVH